MKTHFCAREVVSVLFIELPHPRARVTNRRRRVNLIRPGHQKRESEECESNKFFHGLGILFYYSAVVSVVLDCTESHRNRVFILIFPEIGTKMDRKSYVIRSQIAFRFRQN
jgi:hypothetical protein